MEVRASSNLGDVVASGTITDYATGQRFTLNFDDLSVVFAFVDDTAIFGPKIRFDFAEDKRHAVVNLVNWTLSEAISQVINNIATVDQKTVSITLNAILVVDGGNAMRTVHYTVFWKPV